MGNCQATEVAAVVVQHPGNGKMQRMYWSISATEVMSSNPGYYVALIIESPDQPSSNGQAVKHQLKLLRPDDTLQIGHVYRLISFEDVIKEFTTKKSAKLGKLLKESGMLGVDKRKKLDASGSNAQTEREGHQPESGISGSASGRIVRRNYGGQWKPALQSIAES